MSAGVANTTQTALALDAARKMINNSKNLSQNPAERCFDSESSEYERKRESLDGLNAQYD
jgi:hypothetical protein